MLKKTVLSFIGILCVGLAAVFIRSADRHDIAVPVMGAEYNYSCRSVTLNDLAHELFEKYGIQK